MLMPQPARPLSLRPPPTTLDINSLLRAHNQNSSLWNNTPAVYQLDPITPEYAFFTPPEGFRLSPTLEEILHQTRRSQNIHDTQHKISKIYFKNRHRSRQKKHQGFTVLDFSKTGEERQESQEKASSYNTRQHDTSETSSSESEQKGLTYHPEKYMPENSYTRSKEKRANNTESSRKPKFHRTRRPKTVPTAMLRTNTEETTRHKRKLKPNLLLPKTIINYRNPDNNADKFKKMLKRKKHRKVKHKGVFDDDNDIFKMMRLRKDKVFRMHVIKKKHIKNSTPATARETITHDRIVDNDAAIFNKMTPPRTKHKWNLDGNDVLEKKKPRKDKHRGMFGDDYDIFKIMKQRKVKKKKIARMHIVSDTTKKMWYSDRMIVESEEETAHTDTSTPATTRQSLKQTPNNDWSRYDELNQEQDPTVLTTINHRYALSSMEYLRAPLSKNYFFKIMEHRRERYMIVFLIELLQIIATKEKEAAYEIVKHADQIIHRQSKTLLWMGHPFLDVTKQFTAMLKVTEITSIQAQAADVFQQLITRHDALPAVVNTILESAETMYDDDEGKVLFEVLKELVSFPNIALSGYWLCNSLINAFLRPFRRLKDTQKLRELMVSINWVLKGSISDRKQPHRSGKGFGAQTGGPAVDNQPPPQKESSIQKGPEIITPRPLWKRKNKHHHRHHKRKRDKQQPLRSGFKQRNQSLTLTSVSPRTTSHLRFRDTTYASYLLL